MCDLLTGTFIRAETRDLLFAAVEDYLARSSSRPGATGRRAMSGGSRRSGWGCGNRMVIACYSLHGLHGHVEEMGAMAASPEARTDRARSRS